MVDFTKKQAIIVLVIAVVVILVLLAMLAKAQAASLTCDPQTGVTRYHVTVPSGAIDEQSAAQADGSAAHNIDHWPSGTYNDGEIRAGAEYILNGVPQGVYKWSGPTPFDITVPALPVGAVNLTVIP